MIATYLPKELQPEDVNDMAFDEFFRYYAMAEIVREMRIEDIEAGTNRGYVASFPDS